jgi:hypothetical protein
MSSLFSIEVAHAKIADLQRSAAANQLVRASREAARTAQTERLAGKRYPTQRVLAGR